MRKIDKFIKEINVISNQINRLEDEYIESYEDFNGNEFEGQDKCASEIENLILMLTHELSSEIGFGIECLKTLLKYIDFRKTFKDYSHEELLSIIDKNNALKITQKETLTEGKKEKNIVEIVSKWNSTFNNVSYCKVTEKVRIKTPYNKT